MATDLTERIAELLDGASSLNKDPLFALCKELAGKVADLESDVMALVEAPTPSAPPDGLIPVAYYVGGAEHRGTVVELHRCTPRGESGDKWVVRHGVKMYTREGHPMKYIRWTRLTSALRARTSMPFAQALAFARKLK